MDKEFKEHLWMAIAFIVVAAVVMFIGD